MVFKNPELIFFFELKISYLSQKQYSDFDGVGFRECAKRLREQKEKQSKHSLSKGQPSVITHLEASFPRELDDLIILTSHITQNT